MPSRIRMPWFANRLVEHYENDTEPKEFPEAYTQYIEKSAYDALVLEVEKLKGEVEHLEATVKEREFVIKYHLDTLLKTEKQLEATKDLLRKVNQQVDSAKIPAEMEKLFEANFLEYKGLIKRF